MLPVFKRTNNPITLNLLWFVVFCLVFIFVIYQKVQIIIALPFPTQTDQDAYLLMGKSGAELGLFAERSPIYSAWISLFYEILPNNTAFIYHSEKIVSISILSVLIYILVLRLFNKWTALFSFAWLWNCKYLVLEPNGSHTMATNFLVLALIFLTLKNKLLKQGFILMLIFSAWCRSEMWPVIFTYFFIRSSLYLMEVNFKPNFKSIFQSSKLKPIIAIIIIAFGMQVYFSSHKFHHEEDRFSVAYLQNFAANYVERNDLFIKYPDRWSTWQVIINENLPGVNSPLDVLKKYPNEFLNNIWYNVRVAFQLPAIVLGASNYFLMASILMCILLSLYISQNKPIILERSQWIMLLSVFTLLIISFVFKAAMRYYEQLMPVLMLLSLWLSSKFIYRIKAKRLV